MAHLPAQQKLCRAKVGAEATHKIPRQSPAMLSGHSQPKGWRARPGRGSELKGRSKGALSRKHSPIRCHTWNKQEEIPRQPTLEDLGLSIPPGIPAMPTAEHPGKLVRRRAKSLSCMLSCPEITEGIKSQAALAEAPGEPSLHTCQPS